MEHSIGTIIMDTNELKIVNWSFKVDIGSIGIGIISSNYEQTDSWPFGKSKSNNYAWYGCGTVWSDTFRTGYLNKADIPRFGNGDIIKMELNIQEKRLKFYNNDQDINLQFDNIDASTTYQLAIAISGQQKT